MNDLLKDYVKSSQYTDLEQRVQECEKSTKKCDDTLSNSVLPSIKQMEQDIEELKKMKNLKVDNTTFNE